jgi:predicted lipid carrier protein YhbT
LLEYFMRPSAFNASGEASFPFQRAALLVAAIPLPLLQPLLSSIAHRMAHCHPGLFARMGPHASKTFLIDPSDLPYVFRMVPDVTAPLLTIHMRGDEPAHDGAISGRFFDLLDMVGGSLDGDALFFGRNISVTGDVEAVVTLRNALDDFDGDLVHEILRGLGPLAPVAGAGLQLARSVAKERRVP